MSERALLCLAVVLMALCVFLLGWGDLLPEWLRWHLTVSGFCTMLVVERHP